MKEKNAVVKSLLMISQIGISMIVPIFLCVFVGRKLDLYFDTSYLTIVFMILGILAAIRNVYILTKKFYEKDKRKEDAQLKYMEDMRKERESIKK